MSKWENTKSARYLTEIFFKTIFIFLFAKLPVPVLRRHPFRGEGDPARAWIELPLAERGLRVLPRAEAVKVAAANPRLHGGAAGGRARGPGGDKKVPLSFNTINNFLLRYRCDKSHHKAIHSTRDDQKNCTQERCKTYQSVWSDVLNQKSILARDPSRPKWLQQEPLQLIMIFRKFPQFTRAVLFLPVTSYAISPSVRWSRIRAGPHPGGHLQQTLADGPNAPRSPVAVN